jgi:beta-glucanase (GH16 family)
MRKKFLLLFLISNVLVIKAQTPVLQKCFDDEFNLTSLDASKWVSNSDWRNNQVCTAPYNSVFYLEKGCNTYQTRRMLNGENITFGTETGSGNIVLTAKQEFYTNPLVNDIYSGTNISHTYSYTAPGYLASIKKFKYGYFETRCKLPEIAGKDNYGIGANFWLFDWMPPVQGDYSEIDIFEFIGRDGNYNRSTNRMTNNTHIRNATLFTPNPQNLNDPQPISESPNVNVNIPFNNNYHTFGISWYPDKYELYIDGSIYRTSYFYPSSLHPMNIILDMNVFSFGEKIDANTIMNYDYKVDYVNCYQYQSATNTTYCDLNHFKPTLYKNLNLGGTACNSKLDNNRTVTFRATDGILFDIGFQVDLGSAFTAEIIALPAYVCQ